MKPLSKVQIEYALKTTHSQWRLDGLFIRRDFEFKGFIDAWGFMNSVALLAEKADHHPNWENVYNRVVIRLSTHDAQGLTDKDFQLASAIDELTSGNQR
ncbi:MAG: 4a-hydroxytetrahydrobiopterin dehydratase [Luminiphilus sp.]|jgi:4a-hydroxytetrahydrobiopterin dehydratase|nr:4a-hydroxytetrahydrobiopterin dehydratase [Luminiphilus sp.]MDG1654187.1 4a-hydroxytetrahydrobiopterin dehydratase [Luminiphilus sp.]